jgi:hypothetical protein
MKKVKGSFPWVVALVGFGLSARAAFNVVLPSRIEQFMIGLILVIAMDIYWSMSRTIRSMEINIRTQQQITESVQDSATYWEKCWRDLSTMLYIARGGTTVADTTKAVDQQSDQ